MKYNISLLSYLCWGWSLVERLPQWNFRSRRRTSGCYPSFHPSCTALRPPRRRPHIPDGSRKYRPCRQPAVIAHSLGVLVRCTEGAGGGHRSAFLGMEANHAYTINVFDLFCLKQTILQLCSTPMWWLNWLPCSERGHPEWSKHPSPQKT